jgi:Flp pilus assembly protein TadD
MGKADRRAKMKKKPQENSSPHDAKAYAERGAAHLNKGDIDQAIADYTEAIRLDPYDAEAYNGRGFAYGSKGEYDRAIADYTEAIRLNPNYANKGEYARPGMCYALD